MKAVPLLSFFLTFLLGQISALEASPASNPVIGLHGVPQAKTQGCTRVDVAETPCSGFATALETNQIYDLYIIVAKAEQNQGVSMVSFGTEVHGSMYIDSVISGCDLIDIEPFGDFPRTGAARLTWQNCQQNVVGGEGVHAIAGHVYVYAYSDSYYALTENTFVSPSEFQIEDCSANVLPLCAPGAKAVFGTGESVNPCLLDTPTEAVTWSRLRKWEF